MVQREKGERRIITNYYFRELAKYEMAGYKLHLNVIWI